MEVRAGYKQTEVGVIPDDWEERSLGSFSLISAGGTPSRSNPSYWNGSIPWVTTTEVDWCIICQTSQKITEEGLRNSPAKLLRTGTLLMALYGQGKTRGKVAILGIEAATNQACSAISTHNSVSSQFVFHCLESKYEKIRNLSNIGNQENLNSALVRSILLPLPPTKAEQEAIAGALSDADGLIESLEQLIAKKRAIKQGTMQELLTGKKRLPGFSGEWRAKKLGDLLLAPPDYGINAPATKPSGNLPTYLRITDIDDYGNFRNNDRVAVNHPASGNYFLGANEVVFARTGASVGKTYLYNHSDGDMVFAGFLIRAKIDRSKLNPVFFFNFTTMADYWNWVRVMSMRSGQPGINGNEYASLKFTIPPTLKEQTAIATILSDMDTEITALKAKLTKAKQIKQGMMQELLTGKIRLV